MNQYADGDKFAAETATDGSVWQRDLLGQRKVGARISAYVEIACDDNKKARKGLKNRWSTFWQRCEPRRQPVTV